jgi:tungstate transport system ATP-binding protein
VSQPPVLALRDVKHRYGPRTVLDVPLLEIPRGQTLAVVGPSGAGKSTLLRLLHLLEQPSEGTLLLDGKPVPYPPPVSTLRRVATAFQRPVVLGRSVRENIAFGLALRGVDGGDRVHDVATALGLSALLEERARSLSGGEMQRVGLARAVVLRPDVLLLDEPAANLDPAGVALVEAVVRKEQERGATIVIVTHNTHQARRLAQVTLLLVDGLAVETAPTPSFFGPDAGPRTRAFLAGEMLY